MSKAEVIMDGEQLYVGDPVYCLCGGWGHVMSLWYGSAGLVAAGFEEKIYTYNRISFNPTTKDTTYVTRTLYWAKPADIIPPPKPKPKKMIKVWDWYVEYENGEIERVNEAEEQQLSHLKNRHNTLQKIDGTEREVEVVE